MVGLDRSVWYLFNPPLKHWVSQMRCAPLAVRLSDQVYRLSLFAALPKLGEGCLERELISDLLWRCRLVPHCSCHEVDADYALRLQPMGPVNGFGFSISTYEQHSTWCRWNCCNWLTFGAVWLADVDVSYSQIRWSPASNVVSYSSSNL